MKGGGGEVLGEEGVDGDADVYEEPGDEVGEEIGMDSVC